MRENSGAWWRWTLLISVPIVSWTIWRIWTGWVPHGDVAFVAVHTHDVFSTHSPLLGMTTTSNNSVDGVFASHPGPLQFQLLAPLYFVSGYAPWSLLVGSALLLIACLGVTLKAADVAGGARGVQAFGLAWLGFISVAQQWVVEPWNPWVAMAASLAGLATGWATLRGHIGWLPVFAFFVSLAAQAHIVLAPIMVILGVAVVAQIGFLARRRVVTVPWTVAITTVLVLGVVWAAPLWEQVTSNPGNLTAMLAYGSEVSPVWITLIVVGAGAAAVYFTYRRWPDLRGAWTSTRGRTLVGLGVVVVLAALVSGSRARGVHLLYLAQVLPMLGAVVMWRANFRMNWSVGIQTLAAVCLVVAWNPWPPLHRGTELTEVVAAALDDIETRSLERGTPIEVRGEGDLAGAFIAPGVYARLVAQGRDVYFVSPYASPEHPRQDDFRNPARISGERQVLRVVASTDESSVLDLTAPVHEFNDIAGFEHVWLAVVHDD